MQRITTVTRYLLGLTFLVFAANYFVPFLPAQPPPPADAMTFVVAFAGTGMMTFIKVIELIAAVALLTDRASPLALALLAPIVVGIAFFHVALAPAGIPIAIAVVALEVITAWGYRSAFAPMLSWKRATVPAWSDARQSSV